MQRSVSRVDLRKSKNVHTVARGILLASDHRLGVEETPVGASANLVNDIGLEIDVKGARDKFARRRLGEESTEAIWVMVGRWVDEATFRLEEM